MAIWDEQHQSGSECVRRTAGDTSPRIAGAHPALSAQVGRNRRFAGRSSRLPLPLIRPFRPVSGGRRRTGVQMEYNLPQWRTLRTSFAHCRRPNCPAGNAGWCGRSTELTTPRFSVDPDRACDAPPASTQTPTVPQSPLFLMGMLARLLARKGRGGEGHPAPSASAERVRSAAPGRPLLRWREAEPGHPSASITMSGLPRPSVSLWYDTPLPVPNGAGPEASPHQLFAARTVAPGEARRPIVLSVKLQWSTSRVPPNASIPILA